MTSADKPKAESQQENQREPNNTPSSPRPKPKLKPKPKQKQKPKTKAKSNDEEPSAPVTSKPSKTSPTSTSTSTSTPASANPTPTSSNTSSSSSTSTSKKGNAVTTKKSVTGENTGRWTKEEHATFIEGLNKHGKEWKKIANMIETRTVVQIRTHAQKYFQKIAKTKYEMKGKQPPTDLVSTASNPNRNSANGDKKRGYRSSKAKNMKALYSLAPSSDPKENSPHNGSNMNTKHKKGDANSTANSKCNKRNAPLKPVTNARKKKKILGSGNAFGNGNGNANSSSKSKLALSSKRKKSSSKSSVASATITTTTTESSKSKSKSKAKSKSKSKSSSSLKLNLSEIINNDEANDDDDDDAMDTNSECDSDAESTGSARDSSKSKQKKLKISTTNLAKLRKQNEEEDLQWMKSSLNMYTRMPDASPTSVAEFGIYRTFGGCDEYASFGGPSTAATEDLLCFDSESMSMSDWMSNKSENGANDTNEDADRSDGDGEGEDEGESGSVDAGFSPEPAACEPVTLEAEVGVSGFGLNVDETIANWINSPLGDEEECTLESFSGINSRPRLNSGDLVEMM